MTPEHAQAARDAFDASRLQPTPPNRTVQDALRYISLLLLRLPPAERAGYVRGPAGGENVAALADGTLVRVSRVMYPDGQIVKVMNDAPNGGPQWVLEDVRPELYVPATGYDSPPLPPGVPVVQEPAVDFPYGDLARAFVQLNDLHTRMVQMQRTLNELRAAPLTVVTFPPYEGRVLGYPMRLTPKTESTP